MIQETAPLFAKETALARVQAIEGAWNTCQPGLVANAYSHDSNWRIGVQSLSGREAILSFLAGKWKRELHYRLALDLWTFTRDCISVHLACEWQHCATGQWCRTHGSEQWSFTPDGLISRRDVNTTDSPISAAERQLSRVTRQPAPTINV